MSTLFLGCGSGSANDPLTCLQGTHQEGNACVPNTLSQAVADSDTLWMLINDLANFYNQNLAGRPVGNQNVTANCIGGGTVTITGSDGYDSTHGITTSNLIYTMSACQTTQASSSSNLTVTLTLNGIIRENGSWNGSTYKSAAYSSTGNLGMNGTISATGFAPATVNQSCSVGFSHTISSSSNTVSGTICGRSATN
jgi:hypothetical protein